MGKFKGKKLDLRGDVEAQISAVSVGKPAVARERHIREPFAFTTQQFNGHSADAYLHLASLRYADAGAKPPSDQPSSTVASSASTSDLPPMTGETSNGKWSEHHGLAMQSIAVIGLTDPRARPMLMFLGGRDWDWSHDTIVLD